MTDSVPAPRIPYGAWPSPITAADVAKGQVAISYPMTIGTDVWWQEGRPDEGGRMTVVHCDAAGHQQALLPAPWNARSRVHEYGGRSYLPVPVRPGEGSPAGQAVENRGTDGWSPQSTDRVGECLVAAKTNATNFGPAQRNGFGTPPTRKTSASLLRKTKLSACRAAIGC